MVYLFLLAKLKITDEEVLLRLLISILKFYVCSLSVRDAYLLYRHYHREKKGFFRFIIYVCFILIFLY